MGYLVQVLTKKSDECEDVVSGEKVLLNDSQDQEHGQDRARHKRHVLGHYGHYGVGEEVHVLHRGCVGSIQPGTGRQTHTNDNHTGDCIAGGTPRQFLTILFTLGSS